MTDIAINVEGLGKEYIIGHKKSGDLRKAFVDKIDALFGRRDTSKESFWALNDVSFEIKKGDAIGVIGRNGAGKSTLLKILSRITEPTKGRFEINGRVSSLLEVGTGFHMELTGRENIFLNGTILGMRRAEIKEKFDEIVEFSGVDKFLDTPVKHYSSGMKVRLAFSVAAHLEPEILIIDEVLAVGDADFQKKCLGKMDEVSKSEGRTVLFVSHSMAAIKSLCEIAIVLEKGQIGFSGEVNNAVNFYAENSISNGSVDLIRPNLVFCGYVIRVEVLNSQKKITSVIGFGEKFTVRVIFEIIQSTSHFIVGLGMSTIDDVPIRTSWSSPLNIHAGVFHADFTEDVVLFSSGKYKLAVGLSARERNFQYIPDALVIQIEASYDKQVSINSSSGIIKNSMNVEITRK